MSEPQFAFTPYLVKGPTHQLPVMVPWLMILKVRHLTTSEPRIEATLCREFDAPDRWFAHDGLKIGSVRITSTSNLRTTYYDANIRRHVFEIDTYYDDVWSDIPKTVAELKDKIPAGFEVTWTRTACPTTHAALRAILPNATHELIEPEQKATA